MLVKVWYPPAVWEIREIRTATEIGDLIGEQLEAALKEQDNNITIKDSEESGIARREKILGIKPLDTASLEDRRLEVLLRWYDTPIYTEVTLRQKLDSVLGQGQYILTIDLDNKTVSCLIELTRKNMFKSVQDLFEQMVPLDYLISIALRWNQYKDLKLFTYGQLKTRTYYQLRNEVVAFD